MYRLWHTDEWDIEYELSFLYELCEIVATLRVGGTVIYTAAAFASIMTSVLAHPVLGLYVLTAAMLIAMFLLTAWFESLETRIGKLADVLKAKNTIH